MEHPKRKWRLEGVIVMDRKLILEGFLPYRLNRAAARMSSDFRVVYGPDYDLTIPEWRVLATLGEFGQLCAKEIGSHSSMHKTKVSRAVRTLEQRRWLTRDQRVDDRREEILCLTSLGRDYYRGLVPRALAFEQAILRKLGDDAEAFLRGLTRIETILSEESGQSTTGRAPQPFLRNR